MPVANPNKTLFVYYQMWGVAVERFYVITNKGRLPLANLQSARDYATSQGYKQIRVKYV
jgi:hypothetical protein